MIKSQNYILDFSNVYMDERLNEAIEQAEYLTAEQPISKYSTKEQLIPEYSTAEQSMPKYSTTEQPSDNHDNLDMNECKQNVDEQNEPITIIDCSDIQGCDLYCTTEAENEIIKRTGQYGISGIHFIDSGNYHYISKINTDRIDYDFSLVLYDHHTDMQKPMLEGMTSCGDWAGQVLEQNKNLIQLILVGPTEEDIKNIDLKNKDKLITFSQEELRNNCGREKLEKIKTDVPFYISIDKDILDKHYIETNWSQGHMSLSMLEHLLEFFLKDKKIIGIDICGECQMDLPFPKYIEAEEKNSKTNEELFEYIEKYAK